MAGLNYEATATMGTWLSLGNLNVDWSLATTSLTISLLLPILLINFIVQFYSLGYLESDPHTNRYHVKINFFVFSMILLVTADNLFVLFIGWEGVGLASYFLINFWYTRISANLAAIKAFLTNRLGDWGLSLGLLFYWVVYGSYSMEMQNLSIDGPVARLLGIALLLGAITKSAQIGLHSWLSRSMEGPTPVSALLHAATMVTAGVYLMLRMNIILEWSEDLLLILSWIGGISALAGATASLLEQDIKKIIAYSTISQLGYMFIAIGFSQYHFSLWHLVNHACFKALLFLSGGALIHSVLGIQDIRKFGTPSSPLIRSAFLIGNLSIMAIPFMTGWWTKDQILLEVYKFNSFLFGLIYVAALMTAAYSIKLFLACFKSLLKRPGLVVGSTPLSMSFGLLLLILFSVFFGYLSSGVNFGIYNFAASSLVSSPLLFIILSFVSLLISWNLISGSKAVASSPISLLHSLDLLILNFISISIFPCSTYLFRNYQGFIEIFIGGTGIFRFIEATAFRFAIGLSTPTILFILPGFYALLLWW